LATGFLTPLASALVLSVMLVAAIAVHVRQGFFVATGGFEYNLVLGLAGLSVAFTGPGALSIDARLGLPLSGVAWGLAAAVVGLAGGVVQLAGRRPMATQHPAEAH
jgi:putative oxidoreductase